jgi:hypothetical protein
LVKGEENQLSLNVNSSKNVCTIFWPNTKATFSPKLGILISIKEAERKE